MNTVTAEEADNELRRPKDPQTALLFHLCIVLRALKRTFGKFTQAELATDMKLGVPTIRAASEWLEAAGYIKRVGSRGRGPTSYHVTTKGWEWWDVHGARKPLTVPVEALVALQEEKARKRMEPRKRLRASPRVPKPPATVTPAVPHNSSAVQTRMLRVIPTDVALKLSVEERQALMEAIAVAIRRSGGTP